MNEAEFQGRVGVVTGAASGIGASVARLLLARGATVAAFDRDGERLQSQRSARFVPYVVDVAEQESVEHAVAEVERTLGAPSLLVHAAGILSGGSLMDQPARALQKLLAVNVEGIWHVTRAVARSMMRDGRGAIVTVSSNAGATPRLELGAYGASKAAATMLTRNFGLELASHGIRCNVVSPGSTDTPMLRGMLEGQGSEGLVRGDLGRHRLGIPLGRVAEANDVAEVVLFLLSDRARHVTMQDVTVDGGATF